MTISAPISRSAAPLLASLAVQVVAAIYFVVDGIEDFMVEAGQGLDLGLMMEVLVAVALVLAIIVGARQVRQMAIEARAGQEALLAAKGAMGELLDLRFAQWGLSRSEADVALFAIKGFKTAEIAQMRNSAEGTVRSQLSQVYAKAGVTSQSMLIAQIIEELV
jgi:DNA-binding CsgD family transcriptional regulator